jgi:phage terminase small subunit
MAGRGPTRKDPVIRQREHHPRSLEAVAASVAELVPADMPPPPDGLLEQTKDRWLAFWSSPVAALVDRTSDLPALGRLFELYDDADRFRLHIRESAMVEGSRGQMVRNPFVKDLKDTQAAILALEDRFGLSPRARLSLNLSLTATAKTLADLNEDFGVDSGDDPRFDSIDGELASEAPESTD